VNWLLLFEAAIRRFEPQRRRTAHFYILDVAPHERGKSCRAQRHHESQLSRLFANIFIPIVLNDLRPVSPISLTPVPPSAYVTFQQAEGASMKRFLKKSHFDIRLLVQKVSAGLRQPAAIPLTNKHYSRLGPRVLSRSESHRKVTEKSPKSPRKVPEKSRKVGNLAE